ncbi:uncharacterized protein LOC143227191 [Tachypleus tridentatus]|uniref:uncharacterized protein LOC143227191 n=1 Tax=Tachypleus tridentatus TaxID=6853 RepID=UPI003FD24D25
MKFDILRIWREPTEQSNNCYFFMMDPSKCWAGKNPSAIMYPDLPSSIAPVPHCPELHVPTPPERKQPSTEESRKSEEEVDVEDPDYNFRGAADERNSYYPNQRDLNDLIRNIGVIKLNAELLTSRLKEWDLLDESVQVTSQRKCHDIFHVSSLVRWALLLHNVSSLARHLELPVTRTSGTSSLIAHPVASKLCYSITGKSIRLFPWLIRCTSK